MVEAWYALLAFTLTAFVVLGGRDLGAGALHVLVARDDPERRSVVGAIGHLWVWHEVWLIVAGGTLFLAFPKALAATFAGYYLALFLVLWSFIGRGLALELGGHLEDRLWRAFWDTILSVSSALLAFLFGVAFGNVLRGVPVGPTGSFSLSFFTTLRVRGDVGILDWYTVSVGVFALVGLLAHGAAFLATRTQGPVRDRCARVAPKLWLAVLALLVVVTVETRLVRPGLIPAMLARPLAWPAVLAVPAAVVVIARALRAGNFARVELGSSVAFAAVLAAAAVGLYPELLHSTLEPEHSLTAHEAAAGRYGLAAALVWWPVGVGLAVGAYVYSLRKEPGKAGY